MPKKLQPQPKVADLPLVEVIWVDAQIVPSHGWLEGEPLEGFGGLAECRDIGYLVRETKKELILAVSRSLDDNSIRHSNTIPRGWVKQIIHLVPKDTNAGH